MRLRPITWFFLSLMFFVAAAIVWRWSDEWPAKRNHDATAFRVERSAQAAKHVAAKATNAVSSFAKGLLASPAVAAPVAAPPPKSRFPYRLSNTTRSIDELART